MEDEEMVDVEEYNGNVLSKDLESQISNAIDPRFLLQLVWFLAFLISFILPIFFAQLLEVAHIPFFITKSNSFLLAGQRFAGRNSFIHSKK